MSKVVPKRISFPWHRKKKSDGFNNVTELTAGFQIGKTTRTTSFTGGESELKAADHTFPAPRIATSFGILVGDLFYLGLAWLIRFSLKTTTILWNIKSRCSANRV
ncbi:MAG: hypothetical protein K9G46_03055 [Flavobacteriales bacterium]|nr:hypothetical protein [Flavobacteriales bacterium]